MNQNPAVDNDLQKAIDDITNSTNSDPVFADPVAAPAPAPAKPAPARAPAPRPAKSGPMMPPAPRPAKMPMPPMPAPKAPRVPMPPAEPKMVEPEPPISEPEMPINEPMDEPIISEPINEAPAEAIFTESAEESIEMPAPELKESSSDIRELKEDILRSLIPDMDNIDISPSEKFSIYKSAIDDLHDNSVISSALSTAKAIPDDHERGEALLHLFDIVKDM